MSRQGSARTSVDSGCTANSGGVRSGLRCEPGRGCARVPDPAPGRKDHSGGTCYQQGCRTRPGPQGRQLRRGSMDREGSRTPPGYRLAVGLQGLMEASPVPGAPGPRPQSPHTPPDTRWFCALLFYPWPPNPLIRSRLFPHLHEGGKLLFPSDRPQV